MNIGSALEITANTIQQLMSLVFLYLFFDKPNGKTKRLLPFLSAALLLLAVTMVGTVNALTSNYLYYLITAVITIIYTTIFLRGKLYLRIIIPIAVSNISIAYLTVSVMSASGALPFLQGFALPQSLRYPVLFVADLIYAAFLFVIYRFGKGKINMRNKSDILAFIIIPLITCTVGLTALMLLKSVDFDGTDLMLSRQREELYKSSVLSTHEQIEKISVMKHDMKSKIMSVGMLISQGEYDKAKAICESAGRSLSTAYTPVHTDNPTLNAIMNVELEKAQSNEINCTYEIADTLKNMRDGDIISLIANLCDNAIEYLVQIPQEQRQMSLSISSYKSYCKVVCKNAVASSVLAENPDLTTTKEDKTLHGKGMNILRELAKKYGGELLINEDGNQLTVSVMMMK